MHVWICICIPWRGQTLHITAYDTMSRSVCRYSLLEDQQKSFLEDSNSSSDDDGDCVAKNGHSEKDGTGKKKRGK